MSTALLSMDDAINIDNLPSNGNYYAGYVDGRWANYTAMRAKFPKATVMSIAVFASDDADCLDVETGDATIPQIYDWFLRQQARKVWKPCVYSSVENMAHVAATMSANGFARDTYRLWSAHYDAGCHICGPESCRQVNVECDGTQWASNTHYDTSCLADDFFGAVITEWEWVPWVCAGEMSLIEFAQGSGLPVSTWLKAQITEPGQSEFFSAGLSTYLENGYTASTPKLPKGLEVLARVKKVVS